MTPEQASELPQGSQEKRNWIAQASAREIQTFIHFGANRNLSSADFEIARTAISIRVAEDSEKSAQQLTRQTDRLVTEVVTLTALAEDQRKLAVNLEKQTKSLIWLTWGLLIVTVMLLVKELVLVAVVGK